MSELLAEVDEMMRQERMVELWKNHGNKLVSGLVLLVVGTGAFSGYQTWDSHRRVAATNTALELLDNTAQETHLSETIIEQTDDLYSGIAGLALLNSAAQKSRAGDTQGALALYKAALDNDGIPLDQRDLATLNIVKLSGDPLEDKIKSLAAISQRAESPWRFHAYLEAAILLAHDGKRLDEALSLLDLVLKAPKLPTSLYERAQALSHVYKLQNANPQS